MVFSALILLVGASACGGGKAALKEIAGQSGLTVAQVERLVQREAAAPGMTKNADELAQSWAQRVNAASSSTAGAPIDVQAAACGMVSDWIETVAKGETYDQSAALQSLGLAVFSNDTQEGRQLLADAQIIAAKASRGEPYFIELFSLQAAASCALVDAS
ncbi:MAG: hypothetical protein WA880_11290 [Ornithinimicrobium sp.]